MKKNKIGLYIIVCILIMYSVLSILPFYFLGVRSLIPTSESGEFHLIPPALSEFNLDSSFGNMATYYNIDLKKVKNDLGLSGYINPNATFKQISEKYNISPEIIKRYFKPYIKYNGWLTILYDKRFIRSVFMTVMLTISSIAVGGLLSIMAASVLARFRKKWHNWIYSLFMLQMIISPVVIIIPSYIIMGKYLGLSNSYAALFLQFIKGGAIPIMIFTAYISGIPETIEDSVKIDGGNRLQYFIYILLPLTKVPFASFTAIMFPIIWNDLLQGLVFLKPEKYTLIPMVNSLQGTYTTNYQAIYAGLSVSIIPVIILYIIFQDLFVKSSLSGAIKG